MLHVAHKGSETGTKKRGWRTLLALQCRASIEVSSMTYPVCIFSLSKVDSQVKYLSFGSWWVCSIPSRPREVKVWQISWTLQNIPCLRMWVGHGQASGESRDCCTSWDSMLWAAHLTLAICGKVVLSHAAILIFSYVQRSPQVWASFLSQKMYSSGLDTLLFCRLTIGGTFAWLADTSDEKFSYTVWLGPTVPHQTALLPSIFHSSLLDFWLPKLIYNHTLCVWAPPFLFPQKRSPFGIYCLSSAVLCVLQLLDSIWLPCFSCSSSSTCSEDTSSEDTSHWLTFSILKGTEQIILAFTCTKPAANWDWKHGLMVDWLWKANREILFPKIFTSMCSKCLTKTGHQSSSYYSRVARVHISICTTQGSGCW